VPADHRGRWSRFFGTVHASEGAAVNRGLIGTIIGILVIIILVIVILQLT
jgi:hypothetical protein